LPGRDEEKERQNMQTQELELDSVRKSVRVHYGNVAARGSAPMLDPSVRAGKCGCAAASGTSGEQSRPGNLAKTSIAIGYSFDDLKQVPDGANLGLGCGNPVAIASLRQGQTVLDLGSGAGFDAFLAAKAVGPKGLVIGVDMTAEMITKARQNKAKGGYTNVEFRLGEIEKLPVADRSVDVILSNCVINLSPDKPQVWREIARVLKPGGWVAVSDLALLKPLPPAVAESVEALVGCVAGAVLVSETERMVKEAGLGDVVLKAKSDHIDDMVDSQDPLYQRILAELPAGAKPSEYVTSLEITARKDPFVSHD
jgi:SAM-dependent methyltransferase